MLRASACAANQIPEKISKAANAAKITQAAGSLFSRSFVTVKKPLFISTSQKEYATGARCMYFTQKTGRCQGFSARTGKKKAASRRGNRFQNRAYLKNFAIVPLKKQTAAPTMLRMPPTMAPTPRPLVSSIALYSSSRKAFATEPKRPLSSNFTLPMPL